MMAQFKSAQDRRAPEATDEPDEATCITCGVEFVGEPEQAECDRCWAESRMEALNDAADARHEARRDRRER